MLLRAPRPVLLLCTLQGAAAAAAAAAGWEPLALAVSVQGAVNAAEGSQGWAVEMALPWSLLKQAAQRATPPQPGQPR
jgi:hypothetical protein